MHGHLEVALLIPNVFERVRDHRDPHVHQVTARHLHYDHDCMDGYYYHCLCSTGYAGNSSTMSHLKDLLGELFPVFVDLLI